MPFVKKTRSQDTPPLSATASSLFVGRTGELLFFVHNILKPEAPTHNILSILGQGGVGKSTLLTRFIDEAHNTPFKEYCSTAIVDERQTTLIGIMERFAQQLHIAGEFEKTLKQYKEALRKQYTERETLRDALFEEGIPGLAGEVIRGVPVAGPFLREGAKIVATHFLKEYQASQLQKDTELLETTIDKLTNAFVIELNRLADAKVTLSSARKKRQRRVLLFFDTFELLATEVTPWLLDHFLQAQVSNNVVLVVAGRDPIEHTSPGDPKRWLPYCDGGDIYWISLNNFTEDETRRYLIKKGITDEERIATIWHLSRGLPLYLSLLTSNPHRDIDPTKDVVVNFLRWIPEKEQIKRQLALDAALFSRHFNQDDLEVFFYVPEADRPMLYQWLTEQPFVRGRSQDGRYLYHDVAQYLFSRHLYQRSPKHYYEIRRALATYYQKLLEKIQSERGNEGYYSGGELELLLAVVHQLLLLPDQANHSKAIEHILNACSGHTHKEQDTAIARALRDLSQEPSPELISSAARDVAIQLSLCVGTDFGSQEWLEASGALLEKVVDVPSFPSELLAGIYRRRGNAYRYLQEKELALENYQQVLKLLEPTSYSERGRMYWESENYQGALASYGHALEQNLNDIVAYANQGWAYTHIGENQPSVVDFKHILELDSNYVGAYNGLGWTYLYAGEYQQAIQFFDYLLKLEPDNLAALRGRGLTYWNLKEYRQALATFDLCLGLDSRNPRIYIDRSLCYASLKEYQRSIEDCNKALELAPELAEAYSQRGYTYLWLKDAEQAQADFTRSYKLEPTWIRDALLAEWAEMCQEAASPNVLERLAAIAAVDPKKYTAYNCRGIELLLRKHFIEALGELEQALLLSQNRWEAYFWKGMVCVFLEQDEQAIEVIEKALKLELPPILLTPLRWFEWDKPDFYGLHIVPVLAQYA